MFGIEYRDSSDESIEKIIGTEFSKYASKNGVECNYSPFYFVAKDNNEIIGVLTGHSYYKEVYVSELIVLEQFRSKHIGSQLIEAVENYYKDKGFENINLSTYDFQAPEFYRKCGFQLEFVREDTKNPKLTKYFYIKYFDS